MKKARRRLGEREARAAAAGRFAERRTLNLHDRTLIEVEGPTWLRRITYDYPHSLAVDASTSTRAGGCGPSTAAKRSRSVGYAAIASPPPARM